jgi:prepilin peptidase CpaA
MSIPIPHLAPLGVGLACAAGFDLWRRRIPNAVSVALFLGGLVVRAFDGGLTASLSGLGASALVAAALFRPWRAVGLGGGDVKLAIAVAAWVGLEKLIWFALATAMGGGLVAVACYLLSRASARAEVRTNLTLAMLGGDLPRLPTQRPGHVSLPYALAIAGGAAAAFFAAS